MLLTNIERHAASVGVETSVPRVVVNARHNASKHSNGIAYRRSFMIPFFDHVVQQLKEHFDNTVTLASCATKHVHVRLWSRCAR